MTELPAAVSGWLAEHLPGARVAGELSGGYRNQNVAVVSGSGEKFVLRRYLRGDTCAVERDLAVRVSGVVPVPEVVAADPDGSAAGEPVLLSRFADGVMLNRVVAALGDGEAEELGRAVGSVLASIGTIGFRRSPRTASATWHSNPATRPRCSPSPSATSGCSRAWHRWPGSSTPTSTARTSSSPAEEAAGR
ncbi:phosphotransferase [Lentzea sp. HUAS12]|nr:phosphotransferase [Lentzea sp. HUAS12]USX54775.1 phosphotransferase [Lentzea sp. HUAS12]